MGKEKTNVMSEVRPASSHKEVPWWVSLCRRLWKLSASLGGSVVLALAVNVGSTWLTSPGGKIPNDAPLMYTVMRQWPLVLLVGICLLLLAALFWAITRWKYPAQASPLTSQGRAHMLGRLRVRYEYMLTQTLQDAVRVDLGLASRPAAIQSAASLALRLPAQPDQLLPPQTSIVDAYEQARQELLILGEPGTGKSTLLLELARHLLHRAEQDEMQPLPIVVPLSSWANCRLPLQEWLIEQVVLLYDVPRQLSRQWVEAQQVLPLLDGLDEMEEAARSACVAAINTYHRDHLHPLVVCSRANEYEQAVTHGRLVLHTAVVVQLLSQEHVDAHLVSLGKPLTALRSVLKRNAALSALATTPLMLQILILTYQGTAVRQLSQKATILEQQIWKAYVERMVERKGDLRCYPLDRTLRWLTWLARVMRDHNETIFSPEYLQPDGLPERYRLLYQGSVGLAVGLLTGFVIGLLAGVVVGIVVGLAIGLLTGLFAVPLARLLPRAPQRKEARQPAESVALSWNFIEERELFRELFAEQSAGSIVRLIPLLLVLLIVGFLAVFLGVLLSVFLTVLLLALLIVYLLLVLLIVVLVVDLYVVPEHFLLRFWLWRARLFPWNASSFLEDATARILLRRVGGGYSFTHRLLLEYLADQDVVSRSTLPGDPSPL